MGSLKLSGLGGLFSFWRTFRLRSLAQPQDIGHLRILEDAHYLEKKQMAQEVSYFENNPEYKEGPFVMVCANGWRVEVELKGHHCPVLPDSSIYELLARNGFNPAKEVSRVLAARKVDWLNKMVAVGKIVLVNGKYWAVKS